MACLLVNAFCFFHFHFCWSSKRCFLGPPNLLWLSSVFIPVLLILLCWVSLKMCFSPVLALLLTSTLLCSWISCCNLNGWMKETNQYLKFLKRWSEKNLAIVFSMFSHRFDYYPLHRGISGIKWQIISGGVRSSPPFRSSKSQVPTFGKVLVLPHLPVSARILETNHSYYKL